MINRTIAPEIKDAISFHFHLPECQRVQFNNGIPLYWLNAGTQEVVQIDWVFKAGLWEEPQTGIAQAVAGLLKNGTTNKTAIQINEALEYFGASLRSNATNDYHFITLHALTKHLPVVLPNIQEILFSANFPEEEIQIYCKNALQRLKINLEKTEFVANRYCDAFVFGKQHPYGRYTEQEDIFALKRTQLIQFKDTFFSNQNCQIFMAGKVGEAEVKLLEQYFGYETWGIENLPAEKHFDIVANPDLYQHHQIALAPNVQGSIRIAQQIPLRSHPDFAGLILLNTIFGGYFGSRLMNNIREEKGFTYGIHSQMYSYKNAGAMIIATEANAAVCEQVVAETYLEMKRLREELISEEELLLVKNYLLGSILGDLDGPFSILQRWKSQILFDLPENNFENNIQTYKNIRPTTILELANRYLQDKDFHEIIVR